MSDCHLSLQARYVICRVKPIELLPNRGARIARMTAAFAPNAPRERARRTPSGPRQHGPFSQGRAAVAPFPSEPAHPQHRRGSGPYVPNVSDVKVSG